MKFTLTRIGAVVFFRLAGNLGVGTDLTDLHAAVCGVSDSTVRGIFLDFARVARLDCRGIGEVVRLCRAVDAAGRAFGLVNVDVKQRRMLDMVHLTPLLGGNNTLSDAAPSVPASGLGQTRHLLNVPRHFFSVTDGLSESGAEFAVI